MNELKFANEYCEDEYVLLCPLCGGDYLHHVIVETFERSEDAEKGIHTIIKDTQVDVKYDTLAGNPSSRRNGFKVMFYCEHCQGNLPAMVISQHKGQTIMGWEN